MGKPEDVINKKFLSVFVLKMGDALIKHFSDAGNVDKVSEAIEWKIKAHLELVNDSQPNNDVYTKYVKEAYILFKKTAVHFALFEAANYCQSEKAVYEMIKNP